MITAKRPSGGSSSHAPSSFYPKKARISTPLTTPPASRPGSRAKQRPSDGPSVASRASKTTSVGSKHNPLPSSAHYKTPGTGRSSMSGVSIPISALISPHAPSVIQTSQFHMRDPHKPPPRQSTEWSLRLPKKSEGELGSPLHAWAFFVGFVLFPLWWVASVWRIPPTRRLDGGERGEKAVMIDDPQVEHGEHQQLFLRRLGKRLMRLVADARSWGNRCRVMSVISIFTYIPFIILVAIFGSR